MRGMAVPRSGMTMRERQLADELLRIRSTYSFKLGLLLTESLIRKPWKLILLPFSFIKLNIDFIRGRRTISKKLAEQSLTLDPDCLLLFSTSEEGRSSLERCAILAQQWAHENNKKTVIITPHHYASQYVPRGTLVYPITDPKQLEKQQRGEWNAQCEQLLANILETHRPSNALFDGPYPYRGVLNCIQLMEKTTWHWLRPEGVRDALMAAHGDDFVNLIEFGFEGNDTINLTKPAPDKLQSDVHLKVLDGRGYGQRETPKQNKFDLRELIKKEIAVVKLEEWYEKMDGLLNARDTSHLLAAILPPNIEAIATMMERNVPTLCIYNDDTNKFTLRKLKQGTQRHPIMFSHESDHAQIKNSVHTLVEEHQSMRNSGRSVQRTDWVSQILSL